MLSAGLEVVVVIFIQLDVTMSCLCCSKCRIIGLWTWSTPPTFTLWTDSDIQSDLYLFTSEVNHNVWNFILVANKLKKKKSNLQTNNKLCVEGWVCITHIIPISVILWCRCWAKQSSFFILQESVKKNTKPQMTTALFEVFFIYLFLLNIVLRVIKFKFVTIVQHLSVCCWKCSG